MQGGLAWLGEDDVAYLALYDWVAGLVGYCSYSVGLSVGVVALGSQ